MSHPFQGLPTKIMITDTTIIIRIMIEANLIVVLLMPRCQLLFNTSLPRLIYLLRGEGGI